MIPNEFQSETKGAGSRKQQYKIPRKAKLQAEKDKYTLVDAMQNHLNY